MEIKDLKKIVGEFIDERDWRKFQTTKELAESASVEANELLEIFLWRTGKEMDEKIKSELGIDLFERIKGETADILFVCLAISEHLGFDLQEAFLTKIEELKKRYPVESVKGRVVKSGRREGGDIFTS